MHYSDQALSSPPRVPSGNDRLNCCHSFINIPLSRDSFLFFQYGRLWVDFAAKHNGVAGEDSLPA